MTTSTRTSMLVVAAVLCLCLSSVCHAQNVTVIIPGPAVSCAVGAVGSNSTCCSMTINDTTDLWIVLLSIRVCQESSSGCVRCFETDVAYNSSAESQARLDRSVSLIMSANCWGGVIAQPHNGYPQTIPSAFDFNNQVSISHCTANFPINGGWSNFTASTPCINSQQNATRSCSNPAPMRGGLNCTGEAVTTQACVMPTPVSPSSLSASSTGGSASQSGSTISAAVAVRVASFSSSLLLCLFTAVAVVVSF
jgi:hypothetical protein